MMNEIKPIGAISNSEKELISGLDKISRRFIEKLPAPDSNLKITVIIPAKNEGENITQTLASLAGQLNADGSLFDSSIFEILVLCHNCSDSTKAVSTRFFKNNPQIHGLVLMLNSEVANTVGSARRILMNIAFHRITDDNGFIVTTDADTIADKYWLYNLHEYVCQNADLICGYIISDPSKLQEQAKNYLIAKDEYLLLKSRLESVLLPDPNNSWPRHGFNWGPNLAIKKSVYGAIGGMRPLHFLEDVDMYNRVVSSGYIARHCLKCKVTTSTRIESRCHEGFGAELRVWTDISGVSYNVEGLEKLLLRFKIYKLLQNYFLSSNPHLLKEIVELSFIEEEELHKLIKNSARKEAALISMQIYLNQSESWNSVYPNTDIFKVRDELITWFATQPQQDFTSASPIAQVHTDLR